MGNIQDLYDNLKLDAIVILSHTNVFYYSEFSSSNAQIVVTKSGKYFLTDPRYYFEAKNAVGDKFEVLNATFDSIAELTKGCNTVGWDDNVLYSEYIQLRNVLKDKMLVPISNNIAKQRESKSQEELDKIKKAQSITDKAFLEILPYIDKGVTEIDIASRLEYLLLKEGAELAFDAIVAFGPNASVPHWHRSETKLDEGQFVLMDFGAKYQGYCSDMTRTVCLGTPSEFNGSIYDMVLNAQEKAISEIKANMIGADCHNIAKNYFADYGYDQYFTHALGHGVGIDIHEGNNFSPKCNNPIAKNSVMSVEPGLYIDGKVGVRIEDIVVLQDDGVIDLTQSDKKLIKL